MAINRKKGAQDRLDRLRKAGSRFRAVMRSHPLLNTTWRVGVFTVGISVMGAGLIMLVTPGPGWAGIFVGLAILATEFAWAQRMLTTAKRAAERARDRALDPRVRRRNTIVAVAIGILSAAAIICYLIIFGLALPFSI